MTTQYDDLTTYEMTATGFGDAGDDAMSDEETAAWSEDAARAEYALWLTTQADDEADEAAEWRRMERDAAELDDEALAEAANEARFMFPYSAWGRLVIAAYEERMAERAEAEAW